MGPTGASVVVRTGGRLFGVGDRHRPHQLERPCQVTSAHTSGLREVLAYPAAPSSFDGSATRACPGAVRSPFWLITFTSSRSRFPRLSRTFSTTLR